MKYSVSKAFLLIMISLAIFSCKKDDSPIDKTNMAETSNPIDIDSLAHNYYEQYLKFYPLEATSQGDTRYNDQLPINISKTFISDEVSFYTSIQKDLKQIDYDRLSDDKKIIYDVLDYTLKDKQERYAYHPEYIPFTQFSGLPLDFPLLGSGEGSQPFSTEKDYENWAKRMDQFPIWMDAAIANFKQGMANGVVLPKSLVLKMIPQMNAEEIVSLDFNKNIFYGPIKKLPKDFKPVIANKYTKLYQDAIKSKIVPAYTKMHDFLVKEYLPKSRLTDGYNALPEGSNAYSFYVKSWTTTNKSPDDIHKIGLTEVARIRSEMEKVKKQVGFKGSLDEFLTHVKNDPKAMSYT